MNRLLYCALRKHGPESVTIHTLAESEDWAELCRYERMFIAFYGSNRRGSGYNLTSGGDGVHDLPQESRAKISTARSVKLADPEYRERVCARLNAALCARWATDTHYREKATARLANNNRNQKPRALAAFDAGIPDYGEDAGIDAPPLDFVESVRVAVWRSPMGYTQLGRAADVHPATIHAFSTRRCHPTDATLSRLAAALGVTE